MNTFLWILQGLLAAMFLVAGTLKLTQTHAKLEEIMPWVKDFSTPVVRFVGVAELAAAVGLILPAALDVAPWLTPLAASGLALLMALAAVFHARKREWPELTLNVVVVALALVVAICRFGPNAF
ncbi:DoxX family protein [Aeromicrobium panaciterrae]|uniref:DoxX family protein n=1 Tax=Aeromicrobium panaciterrae TaxID=363861 RepID=UPI0031DE444F